MDINYFNSDYLNILIIYISSKIFYGFRFSGIAKQKKNNFFTRVFERKNTIFDDPVFYFEGLITLPGAKLSKELIDPYIIITFLSSPLLITPFISKKFHQE